MSGDLLELYPDKFYVYHHVIVDGVDRGTVFYVGMGKGNRMLEREGRTARWKEVVLRNQGSWKVIIVSHHENRDEAVEAERKSIKEFRPYANHHQLTKKTRHRYPKNRFAVTLGQIGGQATKKKHGKDFYREIGARGNKAQGKKSSMVADHPVESE